MSRQRSDPDLATAIGSAGWLVGRIADVAAETSDRAVVAYHALRGDPPAPRRRPSEYVAVTVLAGVTGAVTALGIRRFLRHMSRVLTENANA
jgi:hypothetical protein